MPRKPLVALVGRPNVGKSTLFNRMVGERRAIVEDIPGTTRDRQYADVEWGGRVFTLVDTGGLVFSTSDKITEQVRLQAQVAMDAADVIILVADVMEGLVGADEEIADLLRRTNKPVFLALNKADNVKREMGIHEFYALGVGDPLPISALRGMGVADLLDATVASLPPLPEEADEEGVVHIALVGRTNVGKSSLLNRLLGQERVIVSEVPGTTRDAIDTTLRYFGQEIVLIDTAGIRRRGRIEQGIERYSVLRSFRAIDRADVVLFVLDASEGLTAQDAHVAGYIIEQDKSVVVVVNKWDLVPKDSYTTQSFEDEVRKGLKFLSYVPVVFVSALSGQRVNKLLPQALEINTLRQQRISTGDLNDIIRNATAQHSPPSKRGKKLRIYYGTQVSVNPPTFVMFVNDEELVHFTYARYLENQIRERFKYEGSPIKLVFRGHKGQEDRR